MTTDPREYIDRHEFHYHDGSSEITGLTKLEYFTAQALKGLCANPNSTGLKPGRIAADAMRQAQAMIAVLNNATFYSEEAAQSLKEFEKWAKENPVE